MDVGHLLTAIPKQHRYPHVRPGDTVRVYYQVVEGERVRTQQLQGVVMWMTRSGPNANITIRRVIQGIGVERTFLLNSPRLERIDVVRQGKVRRARLYYQRNRTGRRARIRFGSRARRVAADAPGEETPDPQAEAAQVDDDLSAPADAESDPDAGTADAAPDTEQSSVENGQAADSAEPDAAPTAEDAPDTDAPTDSSTGDEER